MKPKEVVYIEYLNAKNGFRRERIYFKANTWQQVNMKAEKWAKKNLESFNPDMVKIETNV